MISIYLNIDDHTIGFVELLLELDALYFQICDKIVLARDTVFCFVEEGKYCESADLLVNAAFGRGKGAGLKPLLCGL